ncbi:hypothetical protein BKA70DRAFT_1423672 [Coprinopsis sp. MPI-PUGE-AT-0042]|nr:hypothetical protein BKA70DRAFT_1423672 [Coprinopsis sp. MPI-PUGE-AT-0042]
MASRWISVDDDSTEVAYDGHEWVRVSELVSGSMVTYHRTSRFQDSCDFSFRGVGVRVRGVSGDKTQYFWYAFNGSENVESTSIPPGDPSRSVDLLRVENLSPGLHNLRLSNLGGGGTLAIDSFEYLAEAISSRPGPTIITVSESAGPRESSTTALPPQSQSSSSPVSQSQSLPSSQSQSLSSSTSSQSIGSPAFEPIIPSSNSTLPISSGSPSINTETPSPSQASAKRALSTGAAIGIALGCVLVALASGIVVLYILRSRRRKRSSLALARSIVFSPLSTTISPFETPIITTRIETKRDRASQERPPPYIDVAGSMQ